MSQQRASIKVRVQPNARTTEIVGFREGSLWVRVSAPPRDGRANQVLIELLASRTGARKDDVIIARGERSRLKEVIILGVSQDSALRLLLGNADPPG